MSFSEVRALSAKYKTDFAYVTVKDRIPVILTKVVDTVYRLKTDASHLHGQAGLGDLRLIVSQLSQLKNQIQTNKPLVLLLDNLPDAAAWNEYFSRETKKELVGLSTEVIPRWFESSWLYVECYFYRRIISAISFSDHLKDLDPFRAQKHWAFTESLEATKTLVAHLLAHIDVSSATQDISTEDLFVEFFQLALWGNKCDLSISAGAENHQSVDALAQLDRLAPHILHDDTQCVWRYLQQIQGGRDDKQTGGKKRRVDIVLDNAGFELMTDLCLAEFLLAHSLADVVHFHVKSMPWFVSDVTRDDWDWTLCQLSQGFTAAEASEVTLNHDHSSSDGSSECSPVNSESRLVGRDSSFDDPDSIGHRFKGHIADGTWVLKTNQFWTLPYDFAEMKSVDADLYADLSASDLIIFKGDLNYRKLTGDLKWPVTTSFHEALRNFGPSPLVTLRTLKCDLVVGITREKAESAAAKNPDWMLSGSKGVIQFFDPNCESNV